MRDSIATTARDGRLLPFVNTDDPDPPGARDWKIMNYNYRVTLTDDPNNRVPLP